MRSSGSTQTTLACNCLEAVGQGGSGESWELYDIVERHESIERERKEYSLFPSF